jgi:hypothetical protein
LIAENEKCTDETTAPVASQYLTWCIQDVGEGASSHTL